MTGPGGPPGVTDRAAGAGAAGTGGPDAHRPRPVNEATLLVEVGEFRVLVPAVCPHRGGRLRHGRVDPARLRITCPLHYSTFDLRTGERVAGPASSPLAVVPLAPGVPVPVAAPAEPG